MEINVEKQKAREKALEAISKQFGKGTVARFGDKPLVEIETISTGSLGLDIASGVGGYARGRIIEVWGAEASAKCLTSDTFVATQDGWKTIAETFEDCGLVPSCTGRVSSKEYGLVNRNGKIESTTHFTNNGKRPVTRITSWSGMTVKSTSNHPHLVMDKYGAWVWKRTSDLQVGDYLVSARETGFFGTESRDPEDAYLLGVLVADSHFGETRVSVTNNDPDVQKVIRERLHALTGCQKLNEYERQNTVEFHANSKTGVSLFYEMYDWKPGLAKDKKVGRVIRRFDEQAMRHFLRGYIDCEGTFQDRGIHVSSASRLLLEEVALLLRQFGVVGYLRPKFVAAYPDNEYFVLSITGMEAQKYKERIGTGSNLRAEQLAAFSDPNTKHTNIDSIPHCGLMLQSLRCGASVTSEEDAFLYDYIGADPNAQLTYTMLRKILSYREWDSSWIVDRLRELEQSNYFYDQVVSIEPAGDAPTFDFAMESTHSFVANTLVTHNTTLVLHAIACVQKNGGTAAFIDAEHALDPTYARNLGVDMDNLYICQPDNGEMALEVLEHLISSASFDLIAVDSVAALVPAAEINGEMGDSHMGLQARLMSQAMRKITGIISKTNTVVYFVNQTRKTMNSYGSGETTTGGNALKFYASQRLEVRRIATLKDKEEKPFGIRVKAKFAKNKVAAPFKETEYDVIFGQGINYAGEVLDYAVTLGFVDKSGSWYSYNDTKIGQGRDKSVEYLKENDEVLQTLAALVRKHYGLKH